MKEIAQKGGLLTEHFLALKLDPLSPIAHHMQLIVQPPPRLPRNVPPALPGLGHTPEGGRIQLFREPVREVEQLHGRKWEWTQHTIRPGENLLSGIQGELFELRAEIEPGDASEISFRVRGAALRYDPARKTLSCLNKTVSAGSADGKLRLQLLIDRTTLEIFADRGRTSLSFFLAPGAEQAPLGSDSGRRGSESAVADRLGDEIHLASKREMKPT